MTEMRLYDLRVTVERIEGRSVCGLAVGDWFDLDLPAPGRHVWEGCRYVVGSDGLVHC